MNSSRGRSVQTHLTQTITLSLLATCSLGVLRAETSWIGELSPIWTTDLTPKMSPLIGVAMGLELRAFVGVCMTGRAAGGGRVRDQGVSTGFLSVRWDDRFQWFQDTL